MVSHQWTATLLDWSRCVAASSSTADTSEIVNADNDQSRQEDNKTGIRRVQAPPIGKVTCPHPVPIGDLNQRRLDAEARSWFQVGQRRKCGAQWSRPIAWTTRKRNRKRRKQRGDREETEKAKATIRHRFPVSLSPRGSDSFQWQSSRVSSWGHIRCSFLNFYFFFE